MRFAVCVLGHADNPHIEAFRETTEVLVRALQDLGHIAAPYRCSVQATLDMLAQTSRCIVIGAIHAPALGLQLPADAIVYQLEQVGTAWFTPEYVALLKSHVIWDYNAWNVEQLQAHHGVQAMHAPLGDTVPSTLKRFERLPPEQRDIDVLMVGYSKQGDRRALLAQRMRELGLRVTVLGADRVAYGTMRDAYLQRTKLVVNAHYYGPEAPFESARAAYCLAHGIPLLSETSLAADAWAYGSIASAPYAELAGIAHVLVTQVPDVLERMCCGPKDLAPFPVTDALFAALKQLR